MPQPLDRYVQKRDFRVTPEPRGKVQKPGRTLSFVVQKHAARRLHYDFRLELDGTLKSWAVPKGPSLDPADKRMAVETEDHPLEYGGFEGVIPAGQYGAGTVIVWDRGEWRPIGDPRAGYRNGKLKFELRGQKLNGVWNLVRMRNRGERQESWLLIKERDDAARPSSDYDVVAEQPNSVLSGLATPSPKTAAVWNSNRGSGEPAADARPATAKPRAAARAASARGARAGATGAGRNRTEPKSGRAQPAPELPRGAVASELPESLAPQLATLVDRVPSDGDWSYEIKFDGYRVLARIDGRQPRLFTRNGHDWTDKLAGLARELSQLGLRSGWVDGEIVVPGENGAPDFQALQNAFDENRPAEIQYYLFDLPFCNGHDLRRVPLAERRALLRQIVAAVDSERIRFSDDFDVAPQTLLQTACAMRMEGVIGKRRDSTYQPGRRSPAWVKLKCTHRQEFVIGGYTDPQGSRTGLGSLLLGVHDAQGRLRYAGNVGTGFDRALLKSLTDRLEKLRTDSPPFDGLPRNVRGNWVEPKLLAEVSFAEWTKDGRVRHAVFHGLRSDKPPAAITREQPAPAAAVEPSASGKATAAAARSRKSKAAGIVVGGVAISNADRVIDPSTRATKLDVARFYEAVAPLMLRHLRDRPVALKRAPQGIEQAMFFQKHANTLKIPNIRQEDLDPGHDPVMIIDSADALIGAAQSGAIEFHTWNATARAIEQPDRMTFDLDPGEGVSWEQIREAAALTRAMLEELGLKSFLKTSGGKGLHVIVPLAPRADWDAVKDFSHAIVRHLAKTLPARFVAKSGPSNRKGRIFVDYLRNGRGATTCEAYSVRARPGLGVSVPVSWDELDSLQSGAHWTLANALQRLTNLAEDPWRDYWRCKQTLKTAMKRLGHG
ncbi:MAG TPA: DNA ligase D [Burkholderiaceae bacterium]|nr:DNA ligase D [Burkholderiaceae bacterium]